jgi:ferredoxin-thioredoxin reductase catalytic chain
LYVSAPVKAGEKEVSSIPERRPPKEERKKMDERKGSGKGKIEKLPYPVWRCKVCGYLCARDDPPEVCPVCKAGKERFERFLE